MRRFWTMLAHTHGQIWNASELARSMGLSDKTVRGYLDLLTGTFMVRQLLPWYENLAKRQIKSPKVYFRDPGLLHSFLELPDRRALYAHPRVGARERSADERGSPRPPLLLYRERMFELRHRHNACV